MVAKVEALAGPAGAGTLEPLATSPVVGTPARADDPVLPPGSEPLVAGELQVARGGAMPPVHDAPMTQPTLEPRPAPPACWADALLDV